MPARIYNPYPPLRRRMFEFWYYLSASLTGSQRIIFVSNSNMEDEMRKIKEEAFPGKTFRDGGHQATVACVVLDPRRGLTEKRKSELWAWGRKAVLVMVFDGSITRFEEEERSFEREFEEIFTSKVWERTLLVLSKPTDAVKSADMKRFIHKARHQLDFSMKERIRPTVQEMQLHFQNSCTKETAEGRNVSTMKWKTYYILPGLCVLAYGFYKLQTHKPLSYCLRMRRILAEFIELTTSCNITQNLEIPVLLEDVFYHNLFPYFRGSCVPTDFSMGLRIWPFIELHI